MSQYMHFLEKDPKVLTDKINDLAERAGWRLITVTVAYSPVTGYEYTAFLENVSEGDIGELVEGLFAGRRDPGGAE